MKKPKAAAHNRRANPVARLFEHYNRDQKLFIGEAMLLNSANVITGGAFLSGLLLLLGASDFLVGLVSSSAAWSLVLSLASSALVERVADRKRLLFWSLLAFRMLTTLPVLLPLALGHGAPTALLASALIVLGNMIFSVFNTGFPVFMMDSLPMEGRANYIYMRMFWLRIAYSVTFLAMGVLLDALNKSYLGFAIVFLTAMAIGIADNCVLVRIQGAAPSPRGGGSLLQSLLHPLKNRRYVQYLAITFLFFFFLAMSSSFTGLYQLKYLKLSYLFITVITIANFAIVIGTTHLWARLQQRIGMLRVLVLGMALIALEFVVYGFLTPQTLGLIVLSPILAGAGGGGYWACTLPYRYSLMPDEGKTAYEGWFGTVFGAAGLLGAVVGGYLQRVLPVIDTSWMRFSVFQVAYLISAALALGTVAIFWAVSRRSEALTDSPNEQPPQ